MKKTGNREKGGWGEREALKYLEELGYRFIEKNYRKSGVGEIDLIMKDGETLVFVEVKVRKSQRFMEIEESIDQKKINRIVKTAENYIENRDVLFQETRIDAVFVTSQKEKWVIKHLKNFF